MRITRLAVLSITLTMLMVGCGPTHEVQPSSIQNISNNESSISNGKSSVTQSKSQSSAHSEVGGNSTATASTSNARNKTTAAGCRSDVLAGVYHPSRLTVVNPCMTVTGTVAQIKKESDRDFHINLRLDVPYTHLINSKNVSLEHGDLVVEVIPMDSDKVPVPEVGQHISVTGAYVNDSAHGWMEIHPAWFINGKGSVSYTPAEARASVETGVCGNGDIDCTDPGILSQATGHNTQASGVASQSKTSGLQFVSGTLDVSPGSEASITVHVGKGVSGSIEVDYSSGPSHARGLGSQIAGPDGNLTWSWLVGTHTKPGDWPVVVSVGNARLTRTLHVR